MVHSSSPQIARSTLQFLMSQISLDKDAVGAGYLQLLRNVFRKNHGLLFFSHIPFLAMESIQFNFVYLTGGWCQRQG